MTLVPEDFPPSPCAPCGMEMLREGISAALGVAKLQNSGLISLETQACSILGEVPGSDNVKMLSEMF